MRRSLLRSPSLCALLVGASLLTACKSRAQEAPAPKPVDPAATPAAAATPPAAVAPAAAPPAAACLTLAAVTAAHPAEAEND